MPRPRQATGVLVLVLACAGLTVLAAVLGQSGARDWPIPASGAVAAAVVALATAFGGIVRDRLTDALSRHDAERAELARSIFMPGDEPPLVAAISDPIAVGVHPAPPRGTAGRVPAYVRRDFDSELREALTSTGFVLLAGDAAAGKTRTAYEAMRDVLPGHVFIAPAGPGGVEAAVAEARTRRDCVLWLDGLELFLGPESGLTSKAVAELLAEEGRHRVVLATLRAAEESRIAVAAGGQLMYGGQAVLDQVSHRIPVSRMFSAAELVRARQLAGGDSRLAEALGHAGQYGIAEYLSSGPQLRIEWEDAWASGHHPGAAALIAAAVDCRRAGFAAPLPRALLGELQQAYLDGHGGMRLRPEPLDRAWEWATKPRESGSSPLWPAGGGTVDVFDYLVDERAREPAVPPVPEATVRAALARAGPADAAIIGATAWHQGRAGLAETAFRQSYATLLRSAGPDDPATLASRSDLAVTLHAMGRLPDAEAEYRAILAKRAATLGAGHNDTLASRNNLAAVLHTQGRSQEAVTEYRAIVAARTADLGGDHPSTLISRNNLAVALDDLGLHAEAAAEHAEVLRIRERVLGPEHPHTVISRGNLSALLRKHGHPGETTGP
jgi:hypothetical protein